MGECGCLIRLRRRERKKMFSPAFNSATKKCQKNLKFGLVGKAKFFLDRARTVFHQKGDEKIAVTSDLIAFKIMPVPPKWLQENCQLQSLQSKRGQRKCRGLSGRKLTGRFMYFSLEILQPNLCYAVLHIEPYTASITPCSSISHRYCEC